MSFTAESWGSLKRNEWGTFERNRGVLCSGISTSRTRIRYASRGNRQHLLNRKRDFIIIGNQRLRDLVHEQVRDVFLVGCFTAMRFSDYSTIDPSSILNNRLEFVQKKTGGKVTIPIHPVVNTILKKYDNALPKVPKNNEFNRIIKLVGEKLPCLHVPFTKQVTYGRELKELVDMKFNFLQTHTARRSFCSNEYLKVTDPLIIVSISGRRSHKSFMRYI